MISRADDPYDDEQPTQKCDLKRTLHGGEISRRSPLSSKKTVYCLMTNLFAGLASLTD
jgi:hypothetical protein